MLAIGDHTFAALERALEITPDHLSPATFEAQHELTMVLEESGFASINSG